MKTKRFTRLIATLLCILLFVQTFSTYALPLQTEALTMQTETESTEVIPITELTELRTENAKHYRMSDGTYQLITYPQPVHYQKEDEWVEIDQTLVADGTRVAPRSSPMNISFGLNRSDSLISMQDPETGSILTFDLIGRKDASTTAVLLDKTIRMEKITSMQTAALATVDAEADSELDPRNVGKKLANRITYNSILTNADLQYDLNATRLKESILIKNAVGEHIYSFRVVGADYRLVLEQDQSISVYRKEDDSPAYVIASPYMFDAAGAESTAVSVTLTEDAEGWLLTLTPSSDWLNDAKRVYPVTLDPTIVFDDFEKVQIASVSKMGSNTTVTRYDPTSYDDSDILLGRSGSTTASIAIKYSLPSVDLEIANASDPYDQPLVGSTIVHAAVCFDLYSGDSSTLMNPGNLPIYRNTAWSTIPTRTAAMEGIALNEQAGSANDVLNYTADITEMVQNWYQDPSTNYGLTITPPDSLTSKYYNLLIADFDAEGENYNVNLAPALVISYVSNVGLENYWTYHSESLGNADFHINHNNGSLTTVIADTSSNNRRNGVAISHVYHDSMVIDSSPDTAGAWVGRGYMLNIQEQLIERYDEYSDETYYIHVDEDGTRHYYYDDNGTFKNENDPTTSLEILNDVIKLKYRSKDYKEFTNELLTACVDADGNRIEIEYESTSEYYYPIKVKEILSGSVSRDTVLTWKSAGSSIDNYLQSIRSPDGNCVYFTYENDRLKTITWDRRETYSDTSSAGYGANQSLTLTYDANGLFQEAVDGWTKDKLILTRTQSQVTGLEKKFYFNNDGTGDGVESAKYTFAYGLNTKVTDGLKNYSMIYRFDQYGKTISVTDSKNNSKYFEFGASGGAKNKITLESKVIHASSNLLMDSFMEISPDHPEAVWDLAGSAYQTGDSNEGFGAYKLPYDSYIYQSFVADRNDDYCVSAWVELYGDAEFGLEIVDSDGEVVSDETSLVGNRYVLVTELKAGRQYTVRCKNVYSQDVNPATEYCQVEEVNINHGMSPDVMNQVKGGGFAASATTNEGYTYDGGEFWTHDLDDYTAVSYANKRAEITGSLTEQRRISQDVYLSGESGDELLYGALVSSKGLPKTDTGDGLGTSTAITLEIWHTDGTRGYATTYVEPNRTGDAYALANSVVALKDFSMVTIYLKHDFNANVATFDDVMVLKSSFGTRYTMNEDGDVLAVTGRDGNAATSTYNALGLPLTEVDALNNVTTYSYGEADDGEDHQLQKKQDPMGIITKYNYDTYGNVTSTVIGATGFTDSTAIAQYINCGETVYGRYGTVVASEKDAFGNTVSYTTNATTLNVTKATDPNGTTSNYTYYTQNYSGTVDGEPYTGPQSADGPLKSTTIKDSSGTTLSSVSYDYQDGGLSAIDRGSFEYQFSEPEYGPGVINGSGKAGTVATLNTSTSIKTDGGEETVLSTQYYDGNGQPIQTVYGNFEDHGTSALSTSAIYTQTYDAMGRVNTATRGASLANTYTVRLKNFYNQEGNLYASVESDKLIDEKTTTGYSYDTAGRVTAKSLANQAVIALFTYAYDALERVSSNTITSAEYGYSENSTYVYNNNGQVTKQTHGSDLPYSLHYYDSYGRMITRSYGKETGNHLFRAYSYESNTLAGKAQQTTRVNEVRMRYASTATAPDDTINYTYDNLGNIKTVTTYRMGILYQTTEYTYDKLNQLVGVTVTDSSGNTIYTEGYTYAKDGESGYQGNISVANKNGTVYNYNYDTGWSDLLTSVTDANGNVVRSFTYDAIGNPITDTGKTYEWIYGRQLYRITNTDGTKTTYYYTFDGTRDKKVVGTDTTTYLLDGSTILAEKRTGSINTTLEYYYDQTGLEYIVHNGNTYWPLKNLQGDIIGLAQRNSNGSATLVCRYEYSAFGELLSVTDANGNPITAANHIANLNPFRYRGYYYDTETGLYYVSSRYYDPEIGRWINADNQLSTGSDLTGLNLFAYCGNNPVNRIDPTGEAWWHWVLGAAVVAVAAVATVVTCGGFAAAATAVCTVGSGVAAATTASTVAAGAFIGSATVYGMAVLSAASTSSSVQEFNDQGNWGTVAATILGGLVSGYDGYTMSKAQTPTSTPTGKGTQNPKVKAAVQKGQAMHKQMDYGPGVLKEQTIAPGCRVDGIDFNNRIIYELKPNNPQAIARGMNQLNRYTSAASQQFGGIWTGVLKLYD